MLFQLVLTKFFKSELFSNSFLLKVDHVINQCFKCSIADPTPFCMHCNLQNVIVSEGFGVGGGEVAYSRMYIFLFCYRQLLYLGQDVTNRLMD